MLNIMLSRIDDSAESTELECNSEYFLLINKLWRQQHGRAVKKRLLVKLVDGTRWRAKDK